MSTDLKNKDIVIVGLGYVGLPLATEFCQNRKVIGFDVNTEKVTQLNEGIDKTFAVKNELLSECLSKGQISFTSQESDVAGKDIYIVAVPTPIDANNTPDLRALKSASQTVGRVLHKGSVVIFESTVFPGCSEEICVPLLEQESGLKFNQDFFVGYSPERMNPGDDSKTVRDIVKVTSGSTPEIAKQVDDLYLEIVDAGTYQASSIRVAEAAKVIENAQRDINIAFVNELSVIFHQLGLDTNEVLKAAGTKWNFLKFSPGLVGGHCIGVDPFYLTHKAEQVGYHPEVILAGRRINDSMGSYVAKRLVKLMIQKSQKVYGAKVLVLGLSFKENCPDTRNSKVFDLIEELDEFGCAVSVHDPWVSEEVYQKNSSSWPNFSWQQKVSDSDFSNYQAVVIAVPHKQFVNLVWTPNVLETTVIYDIKGIYPRKLVDERL